MLRLSLLSLLISCGVIYDLSLLSLSRILNLSEIHSWTLEILAVHINSLCACMQVVIVVIINELRSCFCFFIVVTKQDLKFKQNLFMNIGDIGCAR